MCNQNIGGGVDKWMRDQLSWLVDKPRNAVSSVDPTLEKEELTNYFPLRNASEPLVRIINRSQDGIDFWLADDAVGYAYRTEPAAAEFCRNRQQRRSIYVGFSFRCEQTQQFPLRINGEIMSARHEEMIVAYDCALRGAGR
jgi:hypothetical protein